MKKIITALAEPQLNNELKKEKDFIVIGKDIQYQEGVIEILETEKEVDFLIISEALPGNEKLENLIEKIKQINNEVNIVIILENKKEDIGSVTFVDKVKNIQPTKKQPTRKGVYEDHYILRYVKYAIVIIIVIAIIIVLGYSFVFMKSNDSSFKNSNTSKTETSETLKKKTTETDKKKTTKSDTTKKDEQTSTEITFTKNADGDYSFKLPDGYDQETFKLKVDFTFATRVDLHVNGDPNSYQTDTFKRGVYSGSLAPSMSDALKDDSACESVELEFNVNDFQYLEFSYSWNIGHRYYINDQKLPLEESDHNNTIKTFKLTMVK